MSDDDFPSISAYARLRGVSQPYISKLKAKGVLPMVDGKVDRVKADAVLDGSADPAKRPARAPGNGADNQGSLILETPIARATAKDRDAAADLKLLRIARERGKVVDSDGVISAVADNSEAAVALLLTMPDRIASRLAAESDPRKAHSMLAAEIAAVCQQIAKAARAFQERLVPSN